MIRTNHSYLTHTAMMFNNHYAIRNDNNVILEINVLSECRL